MGRAVAGLHILARVIIAVVGIIALIIAVAILLRVLRANPDNGIVSVLDTVARWLVGPFDGMFKPRDRRVEIAVNWGIALVFYVLVGRLLAGLADRVSPDP
jgi:hypothetical protein